MTGSLKQQRPESSTDLNTVLDLLRSKFAERAEEHDRDGSFPFENFALLHEFGLLSLTIPRDVGGGGANLATIACVIRAIALDCLRLGLARQLRPQRDRIWPH